MAEPGEHRLTIFDVQSGEEHNILEAVVNPSGDLLLEGCDAGPLAEKFLGDWDYEYWRVVKAPQVPLVLLHLIKDRFHKESEFASWLQEKGIPSEFSSY